MVREIRHGANLHYTVEQNCRVSNMASKKLKV